MIKRICIISIIIFCLPSTTIAQLELQDKFGRNLENQTIILVDWEGYMANPAIELSISAPPGSSFPLTVNLSADNARLYFDTPSTVGASGPSKEIVLNSTSPVSFYLSIFPDREDLDEFYCLKASSVLGGQTFNLHVVDQDQPTTTNNYIQLDFSQDDTEHLFDDAGRRNAVVSAAEDWSFFIGDMGLDLVMPNTESTFIWDENLVSGSFTQNSNSYNGFLLYAYGIHVDPHISGGAPSLHAFHTTGLGPTSLRRSGGYNADPHGNFNTLGWNTNITDDTWYLGTNTGDVSNDIYSIALHEIGHALCFNPGYPNFDVYKNQGFIDDADVVDYQGSTIPVDNFDHLFNGSFIIDRVSRKGVFGSEYSEEMPLGRWLITKLNLLILQAIGYTVRETSAFIPISIAQKNFNNGRLNRQYLEFVDVSGGIPFYHYEIVGGSMPPGLQLDSFNGRIAGIPTQLGVFQMTIQVTDYDMKEDQMVVTIEIGEDCPQDSYISGNLNDDLYEAVNSISSLGQTSIMNINSVLIKASDMVQFDPGFEVIKPSEMNVAMEDCDN